MRACRKAYTTHCPELETLWVLVVPLRHSMPKNGRVASVDSGVQQLYEVLEVVKDGIVLNNALFAHTCFEVGDF